MVEKMHDSFLSSPRTASKETNAAAQKGRRRNISIWRTRQQWEAEMVSYKNILTPRRVYVALDHRPQV